LKIERDSQTYRDLCHLLQRAELEALRRATERDQGDYIKCGFLDYHAKMKRAGEKQLFPEIERDKRGQISGKPSRFFGRYFAKIGVKVDRRQNFHSFRHGVADALRRAGHLDAEFDFLLGHTSTQTGHYGVISQGDLDRRVRLIESIAYEGLDLGHLLV
jgi:integrase